MTDHPDPLFERVFGDGLFPDGQQATDPLSSDDLEAAFTATTSAAVGGHVEIGSREPRFAGDTSQLPDEVCWTLQELVAAPHVRQQVGKHWAVLIQHEDVLRSRLSELGLMLEINRDHGYAFTRQGDDPSPHARVLLRARPLSLAASALALYLYGQYLLAPNDPVVETADMIEHMLAYKAPADTDEAGFVKKVQAAIRVLDEAHIIKPVPGTSRYLIYGVITSLLSADRVEALTARYMAVAAGQAPSGPANGSDADEGAGEEAGDE